MTNPEQLEINLALKKVADSNANVFGNGCRTALDLQIMDSDKSARFNQTVLSTFHEERMTTISKA